MNDAFNTVYEWPIVGLYKQIRESESVSVWDSERDRNREREREREREIEWSEIK